MQQGSSFFDFFSALPIGYTFGCLLVLSKISEVCALPSRVLDGQLLLDCIDIVFILGGGKFHLDWQYKLAMSEGPGPSSFNARLNRTTRQLLPLKSR